MFENGVFKLSFVSFTPIVMERISLRKPRTNDLSNERNGRKYECCRNHRGNG